MLLIKKILDKISVIKYINEITKGKKNKNKKYIIEKEIIKIREIKNNLIKYVGIFSIFFTLISSLFSFSISIKGIIENNKNKINEQIEELSNNLLVNENLTIESTNLIITSIKNIKNMDTYNNLSQFKKQKLENILYKYEGIKDEEMDINKITDNIINKYDFLEKNNRLINNIKEKSEIYYNKNKEDYNNNLVYLNLLFDKILLYIIFFYIVFITYIFFLNTKERILHEELYKLLK